MMSTAETRRRACGQQSEEETGGEGGQSTEGEWLLPSQQKRSTDTR